MLVFLPMDFEACSGCSKAKVSHHCGLCNTPLCKTCAQFLQEEILHLLQTIPEKLSHPAYCWNCFLDQIAPDLDAYRELYERAKDVEIFKKSQSKESQRIKRENHPVTVKDCEDHDESIIRLAILAVQAGCNGLVDVQITSKKIKNGGYTKTTWSASGIPARIENRHIIHNLSFTENPN